MFEEFMISHLTYAIGIFLSNPFNVGISLAAFSLALLVLVKLGDKTLTPKKRIILTFAHLTLLFSPLLLLGATLTCQNSSLSCPVTLLRLAVYAIPTLLAIMMAAVFILVPKYYERSSYRAPHSMQEFVNRESRRLNLRKIPKVLSFDSGRPFALSISFFNPKIFLSIGMREILTKKEIEAVLLHEIAHVKNASSWFKLSSALLNFFSPFAAVRNFGFSVDAEERSADDYAVSRQKTSRHINSAKRKISLVC